MSFYKEVPGRQTTLESTLKFDTTPTEGSTNPVTSDGVKGAIDGAVGDAAAALQEQIDDIAEKAGSGYITKGEASVATLNGLTGQENGWLYTMTDAGTLTDGSLAVVAGDTVAWDAANSVWYKAMDYAPRQYGTNEVHNLATTITAFRTGDVIPVDGPNGTAKMGKDDLLQVTAENAFESIRNLETASKQDVGIGNYLVINTPGSGKKLSAASLKKDVETKDDFSNVDFSVSDEEGNVLVDFENGEVRTKNFNSAESPSIGSMTHADFSVIDEEGNVLVDFENGEVRTKNFNSADVSNKWLSKKMSILGDSISTYVGYIPEGHANEYNGSNHGVSSVEQTWWMRIIDRLSLVLDCNESWAGSGVCGSDDGVKAISTARLNNLGIDGNPDLIIIQVGTNDVNKDFGNFEFWKLAKGETYTLDKFRPAYSYIVEKLLTMYPSARIVCMTPIYRNPYGWDNIQGNNTYGYSMTDMVESIKKIAETYHVPCIDLAECGITNGNYSSYLQDNRPDPSYQVHPNAMGMALMANYILNKLNTINPL